MTVYNNISFDLKIKIARAPVTCPAIICMDEPLSNLDAKLRAFFHNERKDTASAA